MSTETDPHDADDTACIPLTPFVAQLMERNSRETAWATNQVIDGYKRRAERAEAVVALIRDGVGALLDGRYMPTSAALERALYPSKAAVDAMLAEKESS